MVASSSFEILVPSNKSGDVITQKTIILKFTIIRTSDFTNVYRYIFLTNTGQASGYI